MIEVGAAYPNTPGCRFDRRDSRFSPYTGKPLPGTQENRSAPIERSGSDVSSGLMRPTFRAASGFIWKISVYWV
jgi:hypothetical protein